MGKLSSSLCRSGIKEGEEVCLTGIVPFCTQKHVCMENFTASLMKDKNQVFFSHLPRLFCFLTELSHWIDLKQLQQSLTLPAATYVIKDLFNSL